MPEFTVSGLHFGSEHGGYIPPIAEEPSVSSSEINDISIFINNCVHESEMDSLVADVGKEGLKDYLKQYINSETTLSFDSERAMWLIERLDVDIAFIQDYLSSLTELLQKFDNVDYGEDYRDKAETMAITIVTGLATSSSISNEQRTGFINNLLVETTRFVDDTITPSAALKLGVVETLVSKVEFDTNSAETRENLNVLDQKIAHSYKDARLSFLAPTILSSNMSAKLPTTAHAYFELASDKLQEVNSDTDYAMKQICIHMAEIYEYPEFENIASLISRHDAASKYFSGKMHLPKDQQPDWNVAPWVPNIMRDIEENYPNLKRTVGVTKKNELLNAIVSNRAFMYAPGHYEYDSEAEFFASNGVEMIKKPIEPNTHNKVGMSEEEFAKLKGDKDYFLEVHFTPDTFIGDAHVGDPNPDKAYKRLRMLTAGIIQAQKFLERTHEDESTLIIGVTNPTMARAATRLGFDLVGLTDNELNEGILSGVSAPVCVTCKVGVLKENLKNSSFSKLETRYAQ